MCSPAQMAATDHKVIRDAVVGCSTQCFAGKQFFAGKRFLTSLVKLYDIRLFQKEETCVEARSRSVTCDHCIEDDFRISFAIPPRS